MSRTSSIAPDRAVEAGLVSVIIPTYNRAGHVERAIASALNQDYSQKEIIVVDDGSVDDTRDRLQRIPSIAYYHQPNGGQASARGLGLSHARGEYIASLDSDDAWDPGFLTKCVSAIEKSGVDFVFSNWRIGGLGDCSVLNGMESCPYLQKYKDRPESEWVVLDARETRELFLNHSPAPSSATVMRRKSVSHGWDRRMRVSDDWLLLLEAVVGSHARTAFCFERLFTKGIFNDNICDQNRDEINRTRNEVNDRVIILSTIEERLTREEASRFRKGIACGYLDLGYHEAVSSKWREALCSYAKALKFGRSWKGLVGMGKVCARYFGCILGVARY